MICVEREREKRERSNKKISLFKKLWDLLDYREKDDKRDAMLIFLPSYINIDQIVLKVSLFSLKKLTFLRKFAKKATRTYSKSTEIAL